LSKPSPRKVFYCSKSRVYRLLLISVNLVTENPNLKHTRIYLLLLSLLLVQVSLAQQNPLSNLHTKYISTKSATVKLDSLSLVPGSVNIYNVPASAYSVDEVNGTIRWLVTTLPDSVRISYRQFPYKLNAVVRHFTYDSVRNNPMVDKPFEISFANKQANSLFDFGDLNYTGSLGRGISVGNTQNAVLNSSLNLQLNGFIGDSLELTAALTDNNVPIQPQGNTQNLNDFDKIFIQIKKHTWQLNLGDIDIRQSKNYFLNFYKRIQGGSFITDNKLSKDVDNSLLLSGSIAKGKFTQNTLTPLDGNQGPYKLQGANGEIYLTVLAGTERVYWDGLLLQRGEDQDYVIDYNTAEVTFTPKRLITKDSRIKVEFEYADRNYLNSNIYVNDEITVKKKLLLTIAAFSNQDAKNSSIDQSLSSDQIQFLANVGNGIDTAFYKNEPRDTFSTGTILYKKIDTVYNATIHDSVFVLSTNPNDSLYNLTFTFVGQGKGDYVQAVSAANGNVYQWVQPINNVKQGQWAPVILLVTPKKQQLITVGAEYKLTGKTTIKSEVALSNYNVNLFSTLGKGDDLGLAGKFQLISEDKNVRLLKKDLKLETDAGYEYVQSEFTPLERLRNVEFNRDWSLPDSILSADEQLINAGFKLKDKDGGSLSYGVTNYLRSDTFSGFRQLLTHNTKIKGFNISDQFSLTNTNGSVQKVVYFRPTIDVNRQFKQLRNLQAGINYSSENDQQRNKITDSLLSNSFAFNIWQAYIKSDDKKPNKWGITYFTRTDLYPFGPKFARSDRSDNITMFTELFKNPSQKLRLNFTYRKLHILDSLLTTQKEDESILGRAEYFVNKWKGLLKANVLYEVGSGQEQKLEYTYVQVPAGQGIYVWNDYNHDGVATLNEFEIALYADQANYIKVYTPSNDYVKTNYVQFNYSIDLNPRALIDESKVHGFMKLLANSSTSSSLQINRKNVSQNNFELNPFDQKLTDTTLLSLNSFLSNTLFFNRLNTTWGMDVTQSINQLKSLLTYGFESTTTNTLNIKGRWNINRQIGTNIALRSIQSESDAPIYENRNYKINEQSIAPSVSYTHGTNIRVAITYMLDQRKNSIGFHEQTSDNVITADIKYNVLSSSTVTGSFSINNINLKYDLGGSDNSTVGYIILDGLLPGQNYLWNLQYTKRLSTNIEISIQYTGRKPSGSSTINTGTAAIRAFF
jgi:hypothetical protein